jgi:hypothetical protein
MAVVTNAVEVVKVYTKYLANDPTPIVYATGTYDTNFQAVMQAAGFPCIKNIGDIYGIVDNGMTVMPAKMAESNSEDAIGKYFTAATQSAMLAVQGAKIGAKCARTDVDKNFTLTALPSSTLGNWSQDA